MAHMSSRHYLGAGSFTITSVGSASPVHLTCLPVKSPFSSSSPAGLKCRAQHALPNVAEGVLTRLATDPQNGLAKLHNVVLEGAIQLGLPLPSEDAGNWWAIMAPVTLYYMFAAPGSLAGLIDFVYAPIHASSCRSFSPNEVEIGRLLGEGSFGMVYEGFLGRGKVGREKTSDSLHVVLKKAKTRVKGASEMHDSEIHMNYRLQRTASFACAEFLGTMQVMPSEARGKLSEGVWMVWNFQGDRTLDYYLKQKSFPENISTIVLNKNQDSNSKDIAFRKNSAVIRCVFRQILTNLHQLHKCGLVHRDVKPLNLILDQDAGKFKFIDFGACVDLRSGYNYSPNETVIDPMYAAPEHYVMPTNTPQLPPEPFCSLVSPLFWHLNTPDRFDLYSAGLILMQLTMKPLRHDTGLQAFNAELKHSGYDLNRWRSKCRYGVEEFAYLDADGGAGWELATALLQPRHDKQFAIWPSLWNGRPSASAALHHRYFKEPILMPQIFMDSVESVQVLPHIATVTEKLSTVGHNALSTNFELLCNAVKHERKKGKEKPAFTSSSVPHFTEDSSSHVMLIGKLNSVVESVLLKGWNKVSSSEPSECSQAHASKSNPSFSQPVTSGVTKKLRDVAIFNMEWHNIFQKQDAGITGSAPNTIEASQKSSGKSTTFNLVRDVGSLLPTATASAVALVAGWMMLITLKSSAHASYEFGRVLMSSSAISGSAFLAFFFLVKPWLEDQEVSRSHKESLIDNSDEKLGKKSVMRTVKITLDESQRNTLIDKLKPDLGTVEIKWEETQDKVFTKKFKSAHSDQLKVKISQAVQELETQMSSLEALMIQERLVAQQQQHLVQKMENLLLQPSTSGHCK